MPASCDSCGAPKRRLWGPSSRRPLLVTFRKGGGMTLAVCPQCASLWCEVAHDPDGAFPYAVLWARTAEDWEALLARDEGEVLGRWHRGEVRARYRSLPPEERRAVQAHRHRSRGRTPLDGPDEGEPNLDVLLRERPADGVEPEGGIPAA